MSSVINPTNVTQVNNKPNENDKKNEVTEEKKTNLNDNQNKTNDVNNATSIKADPQNKNNNENNINTNNNQNNTNVNNPNANPNNVNNANNINQNNPNVVAPDKNSKDTKPNEKKPDSQNTIKEEEPYRVDTTYRARLQETLAKKGVLRPTTIFIPEKVDRTKSNQEVKKDQENEQKKNQEMTAVVQSQATLQGIKTELTDGIALFYYCKKVYIDQFYHISDMFVCCPLYYNYHVSMEFDFNDGVAYHLFDTKEYSNACSHDCCPNQSREIKIELDNFLFETGNEKKTKFANLFKNFRCACSCLCACCSRPTMTVTLESIKKEIGKIIEQRTCCSPTIYIYNFNNDLKYKIQGSCSQCGYCCKDMCCNCCKEAEFEIYSSRDIEYSKPEGKIKKIKREGEKVRPDYEQLELDFPLYANCYDKILLMSATIFLNILYFQNINNSYRCNGGPMD